ncbi:MAG: hypothetical protein LPK80_03520 [Bacteroidota bacterium]|nr:hypothetical protein [Bacteroidota bacterium]MDX5404741.1 hypothetical protein [Bacteroidota bacterium]MDX5426949.1 hypothetical protein [Bacteroidota bacterium]MDX5447310.1 hypothetical protein [Bacteroidota bacterium]MDX5504937.1 hypothetical protein [Bacteroidota bacterium]
MRTLTIAVLFGLLAPFVLMAQEEDKTYWMVELQYLMAKDGQEAKLVEAIKTHNQKYHTESPYKADLDMIMTGKHSGWFVWSMGGFMFKHLDDRPGKGAHDDDWDKNVGKYVQKYGPTEYWRNVKEMSFRPEGWDGTMAEIWWIDLQQGDWYRFKAMMEKVAEIHKEKNLPISVYYNVFGDGNRDVAIVFPFSKWADLDRDFNMMEAFDEKYGEGSWMNMMEEWKDMVVDRTEEVWKEQ